MNPTGISTTGAPFARCDTRRRRVLSLAVVCLWLLAAGCEPSQSESHLEAAASTVRAARRAYAGAPPVIPHPRQSGRCTNCHGAEARPFPGLGIAPPNPHRATPGLSDESRCGQCHVFRQTDDEFRSTAFAGLARASPHGDRLYPHAPPRIPHRLFMHEDCRSCHSGTAIRAEIRCTHPERARCVQCHVPIVGSDTFSIDVPEIRPDA